MAHAKAVFFIDDQQPQVFPAQIALQQLVGADDDVYLAFGRVIQHLLLLFGAAEARHHFDADRPGGEAIAEVVEVLLCQQGGRHQHRHLLAVFHRQEGGAHRHFGFAETDVAAHQAVHRQRLAHVAQHRVDRLFLIRRGFEREALAEQLVLFAVVFEGETGLGGALGVDIQQLRRYVAHALGRFLPRARPGVAAQFVQRGVFVRAAGITADQMQRRNRHVQLVLTGVGEDQVLGLDAAGLQRGQADVAADAVLQMHHRLAGMELRQVADQSIGIDGAPVILPAAADALAEQIAFADQRPLAQAVEEAVFGGADHHVTARRFRLIEALNQRRRQLDAAEQILQRFTPPSLSTEKITLPSKPSIKRRRLSSGDLCCACTARSGRAW